MANSQPSVVNVSPGNNAQDVVLGIPIVVTFDQPMDTSTIKNTTFGLFGPGSTQILTPEGLLATTPKLTQSQQAIPGTFTFTTNTAGNTVVTFKPTVSLRPNVVYTVLVVGPGSATGNSVLGTNGEALDSNYQWTFTTGDLDISVPPTTSPLPLVLPLDPATVQIRQHIFPVGNDLSQQIDFVFPGNIDPASFNIADVLLSLEPILNDPFVSVPTGLTTTATINANVLSIRISGWPA